MRTAILRSEILLALVLGTSVATAQTELFFATGVDSTGWAQAQSNADGHMLIESPQFPHGLWLHLVDEAGDALAGIRVEYQGRSDSLVAIHCVDPTGGARETLVWTRPDGIPLRLTLKSNELTDLLPGLVSIDWRIDPTAGALLEPMTETQRINWEEVASFLQKRWQDQAGRVAVQIESITTSATWAVEVDHPEAIETLLVHLLQTHRSAGTSLEERADLYVQVFRGGLALQKGVILYVPLLFADTNLESVVWDSLGRPQGPLTSEDVASLTELGAGGKDIHSLIGLEYLTSLQRLSLVHNLIVDLTPLNQLKNLRSLGLHSNQIVDLTPLAQLTNLNSLGLHSNQIVDLTPLNQLTNLNSLNLGGNQIVDLTPLNQLKNLNSLDLDVNLIVDLTPLNQLTNLRELGLYSNQIVDLTPLAQLTNLNSLDLYSNQIVDLTPLNQLKNLTRLSLGANQIVDLTPLNQLKNLNSLDLYSNQIVDLTPLNQLKNLTRLSLGGNQIVDLTPLNQLTNLTRLGLRSNQIVDLTPLANLTNLQYLHLQYNQIIDVTPLTNLTNLQWLTLDSNQIADINSLVNLANLRGLGLSDNRIKDISSLVANTDLGGGDWVNLKNNPLSDQARNEQIPALKTRGVNVIY